MKTVVPGAILVSPFLTIAASASSIPSCAFHRGPLALHTQPSAAIFGSSRRTTSCIAGGRLSARDSTPTAAAVGTAAIPLRPLGGGEGAAFASPSSLSSPASSGIMASLRATSGGASAPQQGFSFSAMWGVVGVLAVLMNAIRRLLPLALEPFKVGNFTPLLWAQYIGFSLFMAYAEGYKGFQLKFSPLVVKRAFTLSSTKAPFVHKVFAAPYSMGLFHATKKRKIVSWSLAIGIVGLVKLVKGLSYPYRSIVDAGVVVGLSYGTLSIAAIYLAALTGRIPRIDPALPESEKKE